MDVHAPGSRTVDETRVLRLVGARIRARRRQLGLSQEALGSRAGLHRTYVGSLERGERNIALVNLFQVSEALSISASDLLENLQLAPRSVTGPACSIDPRAVVEQLQ